MVGSSAFQDASYRREKVASEKLPFLTRESLPAIASFSLFSLAEKTPRENIFQSPRFMIA